MTTLTDSEPVLADTGFRCKHCDRPMWRKGTPPERRPVGSVLHSGRGACGACYHRLYTVGGNAEGEAVTTVTNAEPVTVTTVTTVTDPATPPLWHARRVTAGHADDVTAAAELLQLCGLLPAQLAGESAHLLELNDFDKARALLDETNEGDSMATALDIAPEIDMSPATVRTWAKGARLRVASMGTIPKAIMNAYLAAQGVPLAEQELIARPTAPGLDELPVTPAPDPVTVTPAVEALESDPVTPDAVPVTPADLREQIDRLGAGYTAALAELAAAHAESDRLRAELAAALQAAEQHRQAAVASTLPGPLPEPLLDLLAAWHALCAKASEVDTGAAHTLAEVALPALVRETCDQAHDLIRLLDGDVSR